MVERRETARVLKVVASPIPLEFGYKVAEIFRDPDVAGFQVHVATRGDPEAVTLMQFGMRLPLEKNRTLPAAPTVAVTEMFLPLFAVVRDPREIEDSSARYT